jgi:hypothetical protein
MGFWVGTEDGYRAERRMYLVHFGPGVAFFLLDTSREHKHGVLVYPTRHLIFFAELTDMEKRAIP